ncbi:hypothetical protein [Candidatus Pantoea formicae]|uniref:hypothetical protein n=1 Tax=Candidatus Pantoea formicae TaxID=2608355 RepID=UPI003ED8840D
MPGRPRCSIQPMLRSVHDSAAEHAEPEDDKFKKARSFTQQQSMAVNALNDTEPV